MTTSPLPARPGAPIACDMNTAVDTPEERLAEYGRLFAAALVRRERARPTRRLRVPRRRRGARAVEDLARREAACCPFMDYRVEATGDEVICTITNPGRAGVEPILDAVYALT